MVLVRTTVGVPAPSVRKPTVRNPGLVVPRNRLTLHATTEPRRVYVEELQAACRSCGASAWNGRLPGCNMIRTGAHFICGWSGTSSSALMLPAGCASSNRGIRGARSTRRLRITARVSRCPHLSSQRNNSMATSTDGTGTAPEAASPAGSVRPATNDTLHPAVALLSNGRYGVMVTAAGAGYSTWRGLDVTRWREDATRDCWGQFCYVRDLTDDSIWSVGLQPLCRAGGEHQYEFHADRAEFRRRDGDFETRWAVCVAPDADAEMRAVTLVNHGSRLREVELTSFAEVCLNHRRADQAHPAFAKLFLETEFDPGSGSLLARRRPRSARTRIRSGRFTARRQTHRRANASSTRRIECDFLGAAVPRAIPPLWTAACACRRRPARCWIRSSACGAEFASSRERRCASCS